MLSSLLDSTDCSSVTLLHEPSMHGTLWPQGGTLVLQIQYHILYSPLKQLTLVLLQQTVGQDILIQILIKHTWCTGLYVNPHSKQYTSKLSKDSDVKVVTFNEFVAKAGCVYVEKNI